MITADIRQATKEIVLNACQLKIHEVTVATEHTKTQQAFNASKITYDEASQRATLAFDQELPVATKAEISVKFQGTINNASRLSISKETTLTFCS